jgi:two-component system copper resistance phosphate regulon response regulator CusR
MSPIKILVVEDEPKIGMFLKEGLQENGYEVDLAIDGKLGQIQVEKVNYGMIILDLLIPQINGLTLCKLIREKNKSVPILMLTALGTTEDKLRGFDSGADDYLIKPFEFEELLARIKAMTRRGMVEESTTRILKAFDLELDLDKKKAIRGGMEIPLTGKEFGLLELLIRSKGRVISKDEIAEKVWDINFSTGTNFVEVYINLLRKKIDKDFPNKLIHTRFGLGYCLTSTP